MPHVRQDVQDYGRLACRGPSLAVPCMLEVRQHLEADNTMTTTILETNISVICRVYNMVDSRGRIQKGERLSRRTEFKKGQHWRPRQPWWDRDWLYTEYITKQRSANDIAAEYGYTKGNIYYWLDKHGIPARNISETRAVKHWGSAGEKNPMFGKTGRDHPRWRGGVTPVRQSWYVKRVWKELSREVRRLCNYECQICGSHKSLHVHHILPFAEYAGLRLNVNNLTVLCRDCHILVHSKGVRR